jgi:hypothetical protein
VQGVLYGGLAKPQMVAQAPHLCSRFVYLEFLDSLPRRCNQRWPSSSHPLVVAVFLGEGASLPFGSCECATLSW